MNKEFKLIFALKTGKYDEVKKMMPINISLMSLNDLNFNEMRAGETLIQNAKIKSDFIFNKYRINCFADDTGLEIDSLNGMPGFILLDLQAKIVILKNIEKVWDLLMDIKTKSKIQICVFVKPQWENIFF